MPELVVRPQKIKVFGRPGGVALLLAIGRFVGMSFLGIKYSCYYAVYFFEGYFLFKVLHIQYKKAWLNETMKWSSLPCLALYGYLITRYNIFTLPDNSWYVILRIVISTIGCLIVFWVVDCLPVIREESNAIRIMKKIGTCTLEIYVVHYFVVRMLECSSFNINTINGMTFAIVYYQPYFAIVMTLANVIYCIREPYRLLIYAAGRFKETNFGSFAEAVINIVFSLLLIKPLGLLGVAIGTLVAITYRFIYFIIYLDKEIIHEVLKQYYKDYIKLILIILVNSIIYFVVPIHIDSVFSFVFYGFVVVIAEFALSMMVFFGCKGSIVAVSEMLKHIVRK